MPWLLGLLIFVLGPILASAYLSLNEYDVLSSPRFVGLENYRTAFFDDELFWPSLLRTFEYSAVMVPIGLFGSLFLALLLNQRVRGRNVFRTVFYLPSLTPGVALALIWTWLFHPSTGPVNQFLGFFGIEGPGWFQSTSWALPGMIVVSLWASLGGGTTVIFLAGLQGVPSELLDAAQIDGANAWHRFRHVTLPMISPTFLFNFILGVIGALKVFTLAFVATKGGPAYATWFFALHIYTQAFEYFKMGYGAALAWVFVVVLLTFTALQLRFSRRWVYYEGE
ncbi:MAG TPA: sugar ABC transporter permease [Chloroflexota bacterium]|jgi:multiple sugar transport system permease protein|nr:sugar ABC transporter permease [Chloroflexota bacterium]